MGTYSTNAYFYKPALGASGAVELGKFHDAFDVADAVIKANLDALVAKQPLDTGLTSIAALTTAADKMIYTTALDTYAITSLTAFARTILDDADAATVRATLSAAVLGANADITSLTGLTTPLGAAYGGTGVLNNALNTITFTGNYTLGLTLSANTALTLPTSGTLITNAANTIDSDQYVDASIDHEHLAPDVISGLADVTSTDSDYILIWDATDSALKKCDMGEVRAGGDVSKVGTPVNNQIGVWTGDGTIEGDANLTYDGTTLILGTGQINFPDAQNASADVNTLDDYEEGTHEVTATMSTSGTVTLLGTHDTFFYTKIGRLVTIVGTMVIDSVDSPVGTLRFSLPFTSANVVGNDSGSSVGTYSVDYATGTYCVGKVKYNTALIEILTAGDNIVYGDVVPAASDQYVFNFSYII